MGLVEELSRQEEGEGEESSGLGERRRGVSECG
jgi:hypothetical protein